MCCYKAESFNHHTPCIIMDFAVTTLADYQYSVRGCLQYIGDLKKRIRSESYNQCLVIM